MGEGDNGGKGKGNKPKAPKLPKKAPKEVKDFVSCKSATLELSPGKIDWLPIPISPDAKFKPGAAEGSVDIEIMVPFGDPKTVPAKVVDGKLELDPTNLPFGKDAAGDWVKELNDWFAAQKKKFGKPTVKDGKLTLVKEAVAGAAAPVGGVKQGAFLPHVPKGEKVGAGALFALATAAAVTLMPSDSTELVTRQVDIAATDVASTTTSASSSTTTTSVPATVVRPEGIAELVGACFLLRHGTGESYITFLFTTSSAFDGSWEMTYGMSPTGPVTGTGTVSNGLGEIETTIFSYGPYGDPTIMPVGGQPADLSAVSGVFPFVVDAAEVACDASSLPEAPADEVVEPPEPATEPEPEPEAQQSQPSTETVTETREETTDAGPPWSLLLIPGTALFVGGALGYDEIRRREQAQQVM